MPEALEGTNDDSAVMEPNEHLAVFFGLYGRQVHIEILTRNLNKSDICQLMSLLWFEFSMYLDVCVCVFWYSVLWMSPVRC